MTERFNPESKDEYEDRVEFLAEAVLEDFEDDLKQLAQENEDYTAYDAYLDLESPIFDSIINTAYDSDMTEYGSLETYHKILMFSNNAETTTISRRQVQDFEDLKEVTKNMANEVLRKDIQVRAGEMVRDMDL